MNNETNRPPAEPDEDALAAAAMVHLSPPSPWPLLTALAATVTMVGIMLHPAVVIVGALLTLAAIIGWGVEGAHH